jgi:polysaccharide export outer membrane protein
LFGHVLVLCSLASVGCGTATPSTWYSQLPASEWAMPAGEYTLGSGDVIDVRVYDQPNLAFRGKIRSDGRIAMPFVGEVVAVGKTPLAFGRELEQRFKEFIISPRVTVNVEETVPVTVSVIGEVSSKGNLSLPRPATLAQVIAQAGGLTEFADEDAIFVLRKGPAVRRIRFTYDAIIHDLGGAATFPLRTGDVVVVE